VINSPFFSQHSEDLRSFSLKMIPHESRTKPFSMESIPEFFHNPSLAVASCATLELSSAPSGGTELPRKKVN
jgi:hypothetical protein